MIGLRTLVLNANYLPVSIFPLQTISVEDATTRIFNGNIHAVFDYDRKIGHPSLEYTQIPARDATASGSIRRSNYYPNCSYMTNWVNIEDSIKWEAEVAEAGKFEVVIYYTCAKDAIGSEIELSFEDSKISKKIVKIIRTNICFSGLIITDDMHMHAL